MDGGGNRYAAQAEERETEKLNIIVSGGGTGGHIYPALTIIRTLQTLAPDTNFLYVGTKAGLESDIIPKEGLPFATIELEGFERHLTPSNLVRAGKAMKGVMRAMKIVKDFRPDVVIGTGGYVCGPILLAASLRRIPTLIQEQNVVPGITNKILSKFVTKVAVGTPEAAKNFPKSKTIFTGNPIRSEVMTARREAAAKVFGLDPKKPTVLVSGGSRGARAINRAMIGVLAEAMAYTQVQFLHVTGKAEYDDTIARLMDTGRDFVRLRHILVKPYLYNMPEAMALADLAIFRAGATGLAELTARGIPSILVPYPYAAGNHQEFNARALEAAGAARVILNRDLTTESLNAVLAELLSEPRKLKKMAEKSKALGRPHAARDIANLVLEIAKWNR